MYQKAGGNTASDPNVELMLMAQCSEYLFQSWNETYADPLPMELADGKILLTHVVAALSISDQQEANKLLGDPLSCHICSVLDDWMTKAETCKLYELAPKPSHFMCPITDILGKEPMVRAGNTGMIPFSMCGDERAYYPGESLIQLEDGLQQAVVRLHLGDEMVPEGMKQDDQTCIVVLMANYMLLSTLHVTTTVTYITCILHVTACNYMSITSHYMNM